MRSARAFAASIPGKLQVIIVQKQKDLVIDVGQVIYQHRHDRMLVEQQALTIRRTA
jgi:hypothetical protein